MTFQPNISVPLHQIVDEELQRVSMFRDSVAVLRQQYYADSQANNTMMNMHDRSQAIFAAFANFEDLLGLLAEQYYVVATRFKIARHNNNNDKNDDNNNNNNVAFDSTPHNEKSKRWNLSSLWRPVASLNNDWTLREQLLVKCDELRAMWLAALRIANVDLKNVKNDAQFATATKQASTDMFDAAVTLGDFKPGTRVGKDWMNDWPLAAALRRVFRDNLSDKLENDYVFPALNQRVAEHLGRERSDAEPYFDEERKRHLRRMTMCTQSRKFQSPTAAAATTVAATSVMSLEWAIRLDVLDLRSRSNFLRDVTLETIDQLYEEAVEISAEYWTKFNPQEQRRQTQSTSTAAAATTTTTTAAVAMSRDEEEIVLQRGGSNTTTHLVDTSVNNALTSAPKQRGQKRSTTTVDDEAATTTQASKKSKKVVKTRHKYLLSETMTTTPTTTTTTTLITNNNNNNVSSNSFSSTQSSSRLQPRPTHNNDNSNNNIPTLLTDLVNDDDADAGIDPQTFMN